MTRRLALLALLFGASACGRPKVELTLTLPKAKWELGEHLWYKLEVKNVGWRTVEVDDPFWFFQGRLTRNAAERLGTFIVVSDEKGEVVPASDAIFGVHGESRIWTNDCGNGVPCEKAGFHPVVLKRGQSLTATPSIESAVRPSSRGTGLQDVRGCPRQDASREECAAAKRAADGVFKFGDARRVVDSEKYRNEQPLGYRILDALSIPKAGRYSIKAVMDLREELPPLSAEDEMARPDWCAGGRSEVCAIMAGDLKEEWARRTAEELDSLRRRRLEAERRNRHKAYAESVPVWFDVAPAAHPGAGPRPSGAQAGFTKEMERALRAMEPMWAPK